MSLLIWLLFGFATYKVAETKGLDTTLWGILGVLFGIFALVAVAVLPANEK